MMKLWVGAFVIILQLICNTHAGVKQRNYWNDLAKEDLKSTEQRTRPIIKKAKNVLFFLGDGFSLTTITTTRIFRGQTKGKSGEGDYLTFEKFPHSALLKTYNVDFQVPDSAGTATAYLTGVKANSRTVGVDESVLRDNCSSYSPEHDSTSVLMHAKNSGKAVGFVTTTAVTHATPAATYAHSAGRKWASDTSRNRDVDEAIRYNCKDIAEQFVTNALDFKVVFGSGRQYFHPKEDTDVEYDNSFGERSDKRNLIDEWHAKQLSKGRKSRYVYREREFQLIDPNDDEYILGLFEPGENMRYHLDRHNDAFGEPTLANMTVKAIDILSREEKGFVLLIEGGLIDFGHHRGKAQKALTEAVEFDAAIEAALSKVDLDETLIIVTADHSHVFTFGGWSSIGRNILNFTDSNAEGKGAGIALDGKPYTSLLYANGPGAKANQPRPRDDLKEIYKSDYRQHAAVPLTKETHSGEDVIAYAQGPMSHMVQGVHEQNYLAHVMMSATCIGEYSGDACEFPNSSDYLIPLLNNTLCIPLISFVIMYLLL